MILHFALRMVALLCAALRLPYAFPIHHPHLLSIRGCILLTLGPSYSLQPQCWMAGTYHYAQKDAHNQVHNHLGDIEGRSFHPVALVWKHQIAIFLEELHAGQCLLQFKAAVFFNAVRPSNSRRIRFQMS